MDRRNIIYALRDPETLCVRYVGQTNRPSGRRREYLKPRKAPRYHVDFWIAKLQVKGLHPEFIELEEYEDQASLDAAEERWIRHFRERGCELTNIRPGGNSTRGHRRPDVSESLRRRWETRNGGPPRGRLRDVQRAVVRELRLSFGQLDHKRMPKGHNSHLRGVSRSPEVIARISEGQRRRWAKSRGEH